MKTILISAAALHIILFILMVRAIRKAPIGYQDSAGFHIGKEPGQASEEQSA